MRVRNKPKALEFIDNEKIYHLKNPQKGFLFSKPKNPLHVEIGMGKGRFIISNSLEYTNINFLGIEKDKNIIYVALKNALKNNEIIPNLKMIKYNAQDLENIIERNSIDHIYLNFSDPWHKAKHSKRRLTYKSFLEMYFNLLKDDGIIEMRTDQKPLYDFSKTQISQNKNLFIIVEDYDDLHKNKEIKFTTEYEDKFKNEGKKIYYLKLNKVK